ncbi:polyphosphate polymerase domain-containing protein [Lentilactobacillus raoultii]|uniref:Polyphosphate polymerase domain-containing protein n=1 Tax=Lentilactobacillus raoultii TaxID=1987503 RepID=A0ABW3PMT1_9LACO|nr:polyphosphate polymerase domain-containing protein [Lentilactobacillus raoultii]
MGLKRVFKRREYKYLLSAADYLNIRKLLMGYMTEDQYGLTTILSLYFDTPQFDFVNQSIQKTTYKSKFRIRSYGQPLPDQPVFLEIKKKIQGVVYKRRLQIPYFKLAATLATHTANLDQQPLVANERQIKNEIAWLFNRYQIEPKVLIANDRVALFTTEDPDFRVTFDFNLRFRDHDLSLANGGDGQRLKTNFETIMEVKATGAYPIWFTNIVTNLHLVKGQFSKYGYVYQHYLRQMGAKNVTATV